MATPGLALLAVGGGVALLLSLTKKSIPSKGGGTVLTAPSPTPSLPSAQQAGIPDTLQQDLARAIKALNVDATGRITAPVSKEAIQFATEVAGRLESYGYKSTAQQLRRWIAQAATTVPTPAPEEQVPLPPTLPQALQEQIQRAIQLERDPGKLLAIINALKQLPASSERDNAVSMLEAILLQVQAKQATDQAMRDIDVVIKSPGVPQITPSITPTKAKTSPTVGPVFTSPIPVPAVPIPQPLPHPTVKKTSGGRTYTVLKGDSAWKIAEKLTGDGNKWKQLIKANPQKRKASNGNFKTLNPGEKLKLPTNWPSTGVTVPTPSSTVFAPAPTVPLSIPTVTTAAPVTVPKTYTVVKGDSPWKIAEKLTGNGNRWKELIKSNPQKSVNKKTGNFKYLNPGDILTLPAGW